MLYCFNKIDIMLIESLMIQDLTTNEPHCIFSHVDVNGVHVLTIQFILKGYF